MNDVTELVTEASTSAPPGNTSPLLDSITWRGIAETLAVRQEGLRERGRPELVLGSHPQDVAPAVDEVAAPVAPVPAHARSAGSDARRPDLPHNDAVRALDCRSHLRGPSEREGRDRAATACPNAHDPRDAQVAERVVQPEGLVDARLAPEIVDRRHEPVPAALGVHRAVRLRPGERELVGARRLRPALTEAGDAVGTDDLRRHRRLADDPVAELLLVAGAVAVR